MLEFIGILPSPSFADIVGGVMPRLGILYDKYRQIGAIYMGTDSLKARLIRFIISGGSSTALHFTLMGLLIYLGIKPVYATMVGAIAGAILNYGLQYYYTFRSQKSHLSASIHFAVASGLAWLSNLVLFIFIHQYLNIPVAVAQVITTGLVTIQNYFMYKFIFHHDVPMQST